MPKRKKPSDRVSSQGPKRKKPSQAKPSTFEERFTDQEEEEWLKSQPAYERCVPEG